MSKSSIAFDYFNNLILRVANFPVQNFNTNKQNIIKFYKESELFQFSILIASQSLFDDINKDKFVKYTNSLNKYFNRIHFNPVPFGLFSSVDILNYSEYPTSLQKDNKYSIDFSWDHHFLSKLKFKDTLSIQELIYYTNPTIKQYMGNKINLVKTYISKDGVLKEENASIDNDENLSWLIDFFHNGRTSNDFIEELINSGFDKDEIINFLLEIIEIGIIIDNYTFYPYENTYQKNNITKKYSLLGRKNAGTEDELSSLKEQYINFLYDIRKDTNIDNKNYLSVTSFGNTSGHINLKIKEKLEKYILFNFSINHDYTPVKNKLKKFGNEYYHLFCDGYTPLNKVFDSNYGVEYEDKTLPTVNNKLINYKILNKILNKTNSIFLKSTDFITTQDNQTSKLPPTFGVMYELLKCKETNQEITYIKSLGGASALPMLTRFQTRSQNLCQEIAEYETNVYNNSILAEINYIPQTRAKNIFAKEQYYEFSIAINTTPVKNNISLDDLYLNFDGNEFNLFSKIHQKRVIPKITSAIDYSHSNNNLYKFLCDLQSQEGEIYPLDFDFNHQQNIFIEFVPRIFLDEDILLYPAQLLLTLSDNEDFDSFKIKLLSKLKYYNFSDNILAPDEKGYLICKTNHDDELSNLYDLISEKKNIYIKEHIYDSYLPMLEDSHKDSYCHEIISCIKNNKFKEYKKNNILKYHNEYDVNLPTISEWFFMELYCKNGSENDVLLYFKNTLSACDQFFFVRYNYPKNHIRLRLKTKNKSIINESIQVAGKLKQELIIFDYRICPYTPELSRYEEPKLMQIAEEFFYIDSKDYIQNFIFTSRERNDILYNINKVLNYFEKFELSLDEMHKLCDINILSLSQEFKFNVKTKKNFNREYDEIKNKIIITKGLFNHLNIDNTSLSKINNKYKYISDLIHMGLNRSFETKQRFNEFKIYYFTKRYLNKIKFKKNE